MFNDTLTNDIVSFEQLGPAQTVCSLAGLFVCGDGLTLISSLTCLSLELFFLLTTGLIRYLEVQGTVWNTSRDPYLEMSDLQNWGKSK